MKTDKQIEAIKRILKPVEVKQDQNLIHFTTEEKCSAIYNWKRHSGVDFNMDFVNSVHDFYTRTGKTSIKQEAVLDKIISRFKIDIDRWAI